MYIHATIRVSNFEVECGRRPRILVVKMGQDGHDRGSRVISSGFFDLGFDVNVGPLFSTPGEVADLAVNSDIHVIGVSSQADGHLSLLTALRDELRTRRRRRWRLEVRDHMKIIVSPLPYCRKLYATLIRRHR